MASSASNAGGDQFDHALDTIRAAVDGAIGMIAILRSQNQTLALSLSVAIETIELMQRPDVDPFDSAILGALAALREALAAPPALELEQRPLTVNGIPIVIGASRPQ